MIRYDPDSVEAHLKEFELDDYDLALLRHVMLEDDTPQGLHQGGFVQCKRHEITHRRNKKCIGCVQEEEDNNFDDYRFPPSYDYDDWTI